MTTKRLTQRRTSLEKHFTAVFADVLAGLTVTEVAAKYHVDHSAVVRFKQRNAEALESALAETAYRTRETVIADKQYRISEYGELYSTAKAELATAETTSDKALMLNQARGALKAVAEELGQLPKGDINLSIDARTQVLVREVAKDE